ncbi:unnamed protein product [Rhizophagus irregularis]|uniref:Putative short-chain dehydrogenase n=1 Tax=Rhizophagus irregularis TaxID=588596 RepID=A0A2N1MCA4_9GLOM|nr:putative short-chain dehydrogenase [Rhizophagus irregularis]CAB4376159.1 unnamed protein product [Rhizophagus irregularis]CAB5375910.1 unnamed protein product [Rhizophagus irregularis]
MGSLYRYSAWAFFGFKDYTKRGYEKNSKNFNNEALNVDLTGKIAIVTGANSGLGKYVATELFRRGATVHMLCRDETRGEQARQDILSQVKTSFTAENKEVDVNLLKLHKVDISDLKRVKEFIKQYEQEEKYCHILINNAGVMNNERKLTNYGVETNFAINTLGTHFLTKQMVPILQKSGPGSRTVVISSGGMYLNKLDTSDLQFERMKPFRGTMAYAQNKRQQVELNEYWAKTYSESTTGIKFLSMHPGWSDTPGLNKYMETFYKTTKSYLRTTGQGADTILWAAFSKEVDDIPTGSFLFDRKVVPIHLPLAKTKSTEDDIKKLIDVLDKLSEEVLVKDYSS